MNPTSLPLFRRLRLLTCVVGILLVLAPTLPAVAAQGTPPSTELTGPLDSADDTTFAQTGGCFPAGGSAIPDPQVPNGDFVLIGGGWGHGAGMSQYGARGAGRLGCTAEQILTTYFPGTAITAAPMPPVVVIGLSPSVTAMTVTAVGEPVPYELCHYQTRECQQLDLLQPTGAAWTITVMGDASYRVTNVAGTEVYRGGDHENDLRAKLSSTPDVNRRLSVSTTGRTYRYGVMQIDSVLSGTPSAFVTLEIPSMELYLRGLAEVPANWPAATLQAQAISGRSYALNRINRLGIRSHCRCHLVHTPQDQNYEGWDHEAADASGGGNWVAAVNATAGQILTHNGAIAETFYSSSHGGHSESSRFVFGGELAYVQPIDDSRWDLASDNPLRRWTLAVSAAELGGAAGVGTATGMELLEPRGAAGRVGVPDRGWGGVRITGTTGTVVLSGDQVKARLGLRSTLFRLAAGSDTPSPPPSNEPPPPPSEPPAPDVLQRVAASDRIGTAIAVSQHGWNAAPDVVMAASDRFPDALAGVRLAASLEAPLLLTPTDGVTDAVAAELQRLGAQTVWLLGGANALSTDVRGDIADLGMMTRRLAGSDRYATAAAIVRAAATQSEEVTVALGEEWPDAVSASSLAALLDGPPTLLVRRDGVPDATVQAISEIGATRVNVVGGTAVVSEAVTAQLTELGLTVTRLAGTNRFATSAAVAEEALDRRTARVPLVVASGTGFADALSAGALAARLGGVLMLAPAADLDDGVAVRDFVRDNASRLEGGAVIGGTGVISSAVEGQIERLLADGS
ncbi:hypothetical protein BH23ACT9_BH23ACT9_15960 [soil metagenome]